MKKSFCCVVLAVVCLSLFGFSPGIKDRWKIQADGSIMWTVDKGDTHFDHVEMSGKYISVVLRYGVNGNGSFSINKSLYFPMLRIIPNLTNGGVNRRLNWNLLDLIEVNGYSLTNENVTSVRMKGLLTVVSTFRANWDNLRVTRTFFPSTDKAAFFETYCLTNISDKDMTVEIPSYKSIIETDSQKGVDGNVYCVESTINQHGTFLLKKGESLELTATNQAYKKGSVPITADVKAELSGRVKLVDGWMNHLTFESPDSVINTMFAFSKIRACESIYQTKRGPMHGPGGECYYAAIWANDQAEYINPYFPFTGYEYGDASALNSYLLFGHYMNDKWIPIPSSIISEGDDVWQGAGDRGDAAMIAYGAARYALARGDKGEARQLWKLIQWCLEYCQKRINKDGVVESNSDELEGRFPSGKANLNTSSLYYDALVSASYLNKELGGKSSLTKEYSHRAEAMRLNIEKYFGQKIDGYDTYAYYKGNDKLRAWICTPLVMGIDDRAKGTIDALFSSHLWTENGLLSQEGSETFWDRSTLYALRGTLYVGATEKAIDFLKYYSERRLLGEHVPYAIEAWPEGSQRHLSAESGLYGRIFTEGLFGIRPIGFRQFTFTPRLPKEWNQMALRKIGAFQSDFDIEVYRIGASKLNIVVRERDKVILNKSVKEGESIKVKLK